MKALPLPPEEYSAEYFSMMRDELMRDDKMKLKMDVDNFVDTGSLCIQSPDGSWFKISVSDGGTLSAVAVTVDSDGNPKQTSNPYV